MRDLYWDSKAWEDYLYWQSQDKKTLKRINKLIQNTLTTPYKGIGKPEPLKENCNGNDTLRGNGGSDIFVLGSAMGADVIADFSDGVDYLQLTTSLGFGDLDISNNSGNTGVLIRDMTNSNKLLATVNGLDADDLTEVDFI